MRRPVKVILSIIGILVFAVFAYGQYNRIRFTREASSLPVPPGCTKNYGYYTAGHSDVATSYQQEYKCNVTGGVAYDAIRSYLLKHGYIVNSDESQPVDPNNTMLAYNFQFKKQFNVSYDFHPNQPKPVLINGQYSIQPNDLRNIHVTGISLRVD